VGTLRAGERRNVIADRAVLECTVRTFSDAVYAALRGYIQDDLAAVERAFGVRGELTESVYYPCVHNHEGETHRVMALLGDALTVVRPKMIAEDFSYFQHAVPGVFVFCGCQDAAHSAPLHNERFDFDEAALLYGLELFQQLVPWRDTPLG
jgi:Metal-dependent amidase/aminoacylase/carboxypeptidase